MTRQNYLADLEKNRQNYLADLEKNSFENLRAKHLQKQNTHLRNRFSEGNY